MEEVADMMSKTFTTRVNSTPAANTNKFKVAKKSAVLAADEVKIQIDLKAMKLKKNTSLITAQNKPQITPSHKIELSLQKRKSHLPFKAKDK